MESAVTGKTKCQDILLQGRSQVGLPGCPPSSAPRLPCGQALSFSSPAPGDPCAQRGFLSTSSLPLLLPLSPTPPWGNHPIPGGTCLPQGWEMAYSGGAGAQRWTLPFLEHPQYDAFCLLFCLLIIVFLFHERPKRVQLSVIPALWLVDPRGDVIAGSSPTSSRGTCRGNKMNLAGFQQIIKYLQSSYFTSFPSSFFNKDYLSLTFRTAPASLHAMHKPGQEQL